MVNKLRKTIAGKFPLTLWVLFLGIFINRFGSFVSVFLVFYLASKGYTLVQIGMAAGSYGLGSVFASVLGGYMADRFGRRPTIIGAMFSSAFSMLALSQVTIFPLIILCTSLAGLTTAMYRPAASALLVDLTPQDQRVKAFAWYRFVLNLGFAAGTATAGFLIGQSFFLLFLADALSSVCFGLIAIFGLPKEHCQRKKQEHVDAQAGGGFFASLRSNPSFLIFFLASTALAFVYFQQNSTLPLQVITSGLSTATYGFLLSLNGIIVILLELPLSSITQRFPVKHVIIVGWLLTGIGFGLTAFATTIPLLAVTVILWTLGEILHHPASATYVSNLAPSGLQGRYQGAWELTWSIAMTVGPVAGTLAFSWGAARFWPFCGALGCGAALLLLIGKEKSTAKHANAPQFSGQRLDTQRVVLAYTHEMNALSQQVKTSHEHIRANLTAFEAQLQALQVRLAGLSAQLAEESIPIQSETLPGATRLDRETQKNAQSASPAREDGHAAMGVQARNHSNQPAEPPPHTNTRTDSQVRLPPVSGETDSPKKRRNDTGKQQAIVEQELMHLFVQILEVSSEHVKATSDFFQLGGDSGALDTILSAIDQRFHVRLTSGDLFNNPVIFRLAAIIVHQQKRQITR